MNINEKLLKLLDEYEANRIENNKRLEEEAKRKDEIRNKQLRKEMASFVVEIEQKLTEKVKVGIDRLKISPTRSLMKEEELLYDYVCEFCRVNGLQISRWSGMVNRGCPEAYIDLPPSHEIQYTISVTR